MLATKDPIVIREVLDKINKRITAPVLRFDSIVTVKSDHKGHMWVFQAGPFLSCALGYRYNIADSCKLFYALEMAVKAEQRCRIRKSINSTAR